ncbi:MAG: hypothetical protein DRJ61_17905, partial [Acidobacteria bacterium]
MKHIQISITTLLALTFVLFGAWGCGGGSAPEAHTDQHSEETGHGEEGGEHEAHDEDQIIRLDATALERLGLVIAEAGPGQLEVTTELPGEVRVNGDKMAHVGPRVSGVAREVLVSLGDRVRSGQVLAVLESRGLADAKASFLAAAERKKLAQATFAREERLRLKMVSSEQDFLDASNGLAEANIEMRSSQQKLLALGFSDSDVRGIADAPDDNYTKYRIRAPFDGQIIDRHITVGETISAETPAFTVADLSDVWIDLRVYQKDIGAIQTGQMARVTTNHGDEAELAINFVQPLVGEATRTALARIIAPNTDGTWHPGCFVTARVAVEKTEASGIVVPASALIRMEDGDDVI